MSKQTYLKVTKHEAYEYDGSEDEAKRLSAIIGVAARPLYLKSIPNLQGETVKTFTGKIEITGRNGLFYVLPDEILMHDVTANEWYSVTRQQLFEQYRPFTFSSCDPNCAGGDGPVGTAGANHSDKLVGTA